MIRYYDCAAEIRCLSKTPGEKFIEGSAYLFVTQAARDARGRANIAKAWQEHLEGMNAAQERFRFLNLGVYEAGSRDQFISDHVEECRRGAVISKICLQAIDNDIRL